MGKEKPLHPAMVRIYESAVAQGLIDADMRLTSLARLLNVPAQNVKHWESRGPSKEIRLRLQAEFGINATWIETGTESKKQEKKPSTAAFSDDEQALLEGFRIADSSLKRAMLALAREAQAAFEKRNEQRN